MKAEAWVFGITALFVAVVAPAYWFLTEDPTGTSALVMTALLFGMVTLYLGFHASRMDPRPEDRKEGEIAEGAGELGFSALLLVAAVVRPRPRRDRLRHRAGRVVAGLHRLHRRCDRAVRLHLRVLPG